MINRPYYNLGNFTFWDYIFFLIAFTFDSKNLIRLLATKLFRNFDPTNTSSTYTLNIIIANYSELLLSLAIVFLWPLLFILRTPNHRSSPSLVFGSLNTWVFTILGVPLSLKLRSRSGSSAPDGNWRRYSRSTIPLVFPRSS